MTREELDKLIQHKVRKTHVFSVLRVSLFGFAAGLDTVAAVANIAKGQALTGFFFVIFALVMVAACVWWLIILGKYLRAMSGIQNLLSKASCQSMIDAIEAVVKEMNL